MSVPGCTSARILGLVGSAATLVVVLGCKSTSFACENDQSCRSDGQGWCEADGACSFPDPTCPSGRRYGDLGPSDIAGQCVPGSSTDSSVSTSSEDGMNDTQAETVASLEGSELDSTTANADDGSTSAGPTGGISASDTSTTASIGESTSSSATTSDVGMDGDPYGQCEDSIDCPANIECEPSGALPLTCAASCQTDEDCPPATNNGDAVCTGVPGEGSWCVLPCSANNECPEGMECTSWRPQEFGDVCTWF